MTRMMHLRFVAAWFIALLTAFTLFTLYSPPALATPQGPTEPKPMPPPPDPGPTPTDDGGGPAAVALFLVGAAGLTALRHRRPAHCDGPGSCLAAEGHGNPAGKLPQPD